MPYEVEIVFDKIPALLAGLRQRTAHTVKQTADDVAKDAKLSLHGSKSGHVYGSHQASAPGEAPASDSGGLEEAIKVVRQDEFNQDIEVNHPAALALEFGRADGHFAARPYIIPAVEKARPKFIAEISKSVAG